MVMVCQLYMCYQKFEFICHPYGCIEEVGRVKLSMWSLQHTIYPSMWLAKSMSVGDGQVWSLYVNYNCIPASLSGYVIHMDV